MEYELIDSWQQDGGLLTTDDGTFQPVMGYFKVKGDMQYCKKQFNLIVTITVDSISEAKQQCNVAVDNYINSLSS